MKTSQQQEWKKWAEKNQRIRNEYKIGRIAKQRRSKENETNQKRRKKIAENWKDEKTGNDKMFAYCNHSEVLDIVI